MHIAIATAEFVTERTFGGGLANYTANLARLLRENGHEVSIFLPGDEEKEFVWENGIKVHRVMVEECPTKINKIRVEFVRRGLLAIWSLLGKSFFVNKKIKKIDKRQKIDVVQFSSSESLAIFRNRKIPAVVRISTYLATMRQAQKAEFEYEKSIDTITLMERVQLFSIKRADCIFGPSYSASKLTERKVGKKVQVIESPFSFDSTKIDYSVYENFLLDKKYLIFYGTLGYLKGIHTIASVLNRFFEKYPDYYFVFVGNSQNMIFNGEEVDAVEYIYRSAEKFRGNIIYFSATQNKGQLYGLVERAEASVLPSRFDNLPNTCIESMALGQIVIGTNGASFEQLIDDGVNGFLIERENTEQLYEKMVKTIELSQKERVKMCKNAKETVKRLDPEKIYPQLIKIYEQAIRKRK